MRFLLSTAITLAPTFALADAPRVVTDIAPVHSLVAQVMEGVGTPDVLVSGGASPHDFQFTFDQAAAVQEADVIVWVGTTLTPWLDDALDTLGEGTAPLTLLETDGWEKLAFREDPNFDTGHHHHGHGDHDDHDDHDHGEEGHDDHDDHDHGEEEGHEDHDGHDHGEEEGHDDHDGHDHGEEEGHDDHDGHDHGEEEGHDDHDGHDHGEEEGHDDHDGHDHGEEEGHDDHDGHDHGEEEGHDDHDHDAHSGDVDPHAWLDPQVASAWVGHIAEALSEADPDNAATYQANAIETQEELAALEAEIAAMLAPLPDTALILPHDAYQYFGARFDRTAVAAISLGDASNPAPDQIERLQTITATEDSVCVLTDAQIRSSWTDLVREGTDARTAVADPVGGLFEPGTDHYAETLRAIATAYVSCIGGE